MIIRTIGQLAGFQLFQTGRMSAPPRLHPARTGFRYRVTCRDCASPGDSSAVSARKSPGFALAPV